MAIIMGQSSRKAESGSGNIIRHTVKGYPKNIYIIGMLTEANESYVTAGKKAI
jgi:hypothetical protein